MRFLVAHDPDHLRQLAAASSQRWAAGRPLSPLDGVPFAGGGAGCMLRSCAVSPPTCSTQRLSLAALTPTPAVKDFLDVPPYPTTCGTAFMAEW